jgi:hypothetical protein
MIPMPYAPIMLAKNPEMASEIKTSMPQLESLLALGKGDVASKGS